MASDHPKIAQERQGIQHVAKSSPSRWDPKAVLSGSRSPTLENDLTSFTNGPEIAMGGETEDCSRRRSRPLLYVCTYVPYVPTYVRTVRTDMYLRTCIRARTYNVAVKNRIFRME